MRVLKDDDIRKYPYCLNFVFKFRDIVNYVYDQTNAWYFANVLTQSKWIYQTKMKNEEDPAAKKFYEEKIKQFYNYLDNLRYIPGVNIQTNEAFDYDYLIKACEKKLSYFLNKAQDAFKNKFYKFGAFYLGQYYGNKEIIKISKKFKKECNNE